MGHGPGGWDAGVRRHGVARGRGMEAFIFGSERKHKEAPWTAGEELGRLEHKIEQGDAAAG